MAEQVMDVRSSAAFLRQRWRSLATMAAVGAVLGALYAALVPAQLSSTSLLLFPGAGVSPGDDETATQVHLVRSVPVLERAGKSVTPALTADEVKQRIKVDAKTSKLVEIRASSRDARQAQALSQAVVDAYLTTLQRNARSPAAIPKPLRDRAVALNRQLKDLQNQIDAVEEQQQGEDPTSPAGRTFAQLHAQLTTQQAAIAGRLDKVKEAETGSPIGASDTPDVIQPAAPATGPDPTRRLVTWAVVGGLLAMAGTALVLLFRRRRDPRVRARDDLADAVGCSLLAVVRSHPQRSVAGWLALFETYQTPAEEAWAFRQLLRALMPPADSGDPTQTDTKRTSGRVEHPRSLTVIAPSGDRRGMAVGPQLAVFTASLGISTRFLVATRHDSAAALRAACATVRGSELRSGLVLDAEADSATPTRDAPPPATSGTTGPLKGAVAGESRLQEALGDYSVGNATRGTGQETRQETRQTAQPHDLSAHRPVDLTIVFTVADRMEPTLRDVPATAVTLLAISPGAGTREELARLAVAVDDSGRHLDGMVVSDPEPSDVTTGRRTLDKRALQAPLPVRMTGASRMSMSPSGRRTAR
jgi:capsular polysaccharide biosynthesis protein